MKCKFAHIVWALFLLLIPVSADCSVNNTIAPEAAVNGYLSETETALLRPDAEATLSPKAEASKNPQTMEGQTFLEVVAQVSEAKAAVPHRALALTQLPKESDLPVEYVNVTKSEMTLREVFGEIQKQTTFKIAVNWSGVSPGTKVKVSTGRIALLDFLNEALKNTDLEYFLEGKYILVALVPKQAQNQEDHSADGTVTQLAELEDAPNPLEEIIAPNIDTAELILVNFDMDQLRIDRRSKENVIALQGLHGMLSDEEKIARLDYINITALPSPDNETLFNERKAIQRAQALKSHITQSYPEIDEDRIYIILAEEDWKGLQQLITHDPGMPYQEDVLKLLSNPISNEQKKFRLQTMSGGVVHRYLVNNILPKMASGAAYTVHFLNEPPAPVIEYVDVGMEKLMNNSVPEVQSVTEPPAIKPDNVKISGKRPKVSLPEPIRDPVYLALKNNIFADIALLPNLAVEFAFGERYSLELGGSWSWGTRYGSKYRIEGLSFRGEFKWWFRDQSLGRLRGEYIGIYASAGKHDLRLGQTAYVVGPAYSAGLSIGYSIPVAKRLSLDLGLSLGVLSSEVEVLYRYDPYNDKYITTNTYSQTLFGPTRVNASIVWLIGGGGNRFD